jgi:hypothetical protein
MPDGDRASVAVRLTMAAAEGTVGTASTAASDAAVRREGRPR